MPATHLSSMFHRRLVLLAALVVLAMAGLGAQLVRLTVVQGAKLQTDAEAKLVNREWTPAGRGRILDRKGRVLAQDRPSFDLDVDYQVICGEWAAKKAMVRAKKDHKDEWKKLGKEERQALADSYIPTYQAHIDRMWSRIAQETGVGEDHIRERAAAIEARIRAMSKRIFAARLQKEFTTRLAEADEITGDIDEATRKRLERPIEEQKAPQVVLPKIPDDAGFTLTALMGQTVDLEVPTPTGVVIERVPLMPGMSVVAAGDREYPYDRMAVEVDLSTLPEPVRAQGKKTITVEGLAYHILGRMKQGAQKEDNDRRKARRVADEAFRARVETAVPGQAEAVDRGEYDDNDPAGQSGIEESREDDLRGLRGLKVKQLETSEESVLPPQQGRDVQLTIDIALQARVQAAMSKELGLAVAQDWHYLKGQSNPTIPPGTALDGAAVVLDVDSGDILAMVSTPSISREALRDHPDSVFDDPVNREVDVPWVNRAIARPYPPGSIVKALILNGAVKFGKHNLDSGIDCNGFLFPGKPDMFRCWIFKHKELNTTHTAVFGHALSAPEALMVSCNVYFFTLGQRLGPQGITDTFSMFGVGQPWNLGVGLEYKGTIGEPIPGTDTVRPLSISDATQMGIGQGPVAWTPLHAADAYSTIARGGVRIRPRIVSEPSSAESIDLGLNPRAVREAIKGLWNSVNEDLGTGNHLSYNGKRLLHFNAPGVVVWGKTGTAQAPTIYVWPTKPNPEYKKGDPEDTARIPDPLWSKGVDQATIIAESGDQTVRLPQGARALRWGDHSWFVVLVGTKAENRPRYAIAVMMEYSGSGGKVSGPIVNQIIHSLIAEGYL